MSKITLVPGDVYVSEIFPNIPLSQVIEITNAMPNLLEYTKRYLVKLGKSLGMGEILPNQVLKKLSVLDVNSQAFIQAFEKALPALSNFYSYQIIGKLYDAFEADYKQITDNVYNKTILDPVHYSLIRSSPDTLIQDNFPRFYEMLVQLLKQALTNSDYLIGVSKANDALSKSLFKLTFQ